MINDVPLLQCDQKHEFIKVNIKTFLLVIESFSKFLILFKVEKSTQFFISNFIMSFCLVHDMWVCYDMCMFMCACVCAYIVSVICMCMFYGDYLAIFCCKIVTFCVYQCELTVNSAFFTGFTKEKEFNEFRNIDCN